MKYTQGPWEVINGADWQVTDGHHILAFCPKGYPKENATLIAAAPRLLEQLESCFAILVAIQSAGHNGDGAKAEAVLRRTAVIIRQAKGE